MSVPSILSVIFIIIKGSNKNKMTKMIISQGSESPATLRDLRTAD